MKDLKPLLRDDATEFERQLLNAAMHERPSPQLQARMRQGIGLTGPTLWAGNAKALLSALAAKSGLMWTAAAVVVAGGVAAGVRYQSSGYRNAGYRNAGNQSAPVSNETVSIEAPAPETTARAVGAGPAPFALRTGASEAHPSTPPGPENALGVAPEVPPESTSAAAAGPSSAAAGSIPSRSVHAGSDTGQLREEIRLLDRARGALARGNSGEARAALEAYQQRFPDGILTREARLLDDEMRAHAAGHERAGHERASHDNPKPPSTRSAR
jgi:hypothetical protein